MRAVMYQTASSGGHHKYGMQLSQALAETGIEVHLVTSRRSPASSASYEVHRVLHPMYSDLWYLRLTLMRYVDRLARHWANLRIAADLAERVGADIVHLQLVAPWANLGALSQLSRRRPVVITVHNVHDHWLARTKGSPMERARKALARVEAGRLRRARRMAAICVVHAHSSARSLEHDYGIPPSRIRVVPFGPHEEPPSEPVHDSKVADFARRLGIAPEDRIVLFFGSIRHNKGLDVLLEAWPSVAASVPMARLLIAGMPRDADGFRSYDRRIDRLHIGSSICRLLRQLSEEEVELAYQVSAVSALPYHRSFSAQSGVLLTALAHGHPVVASDVGALAEAVRETEAGLLCVPEDAASLASRLIELLQSPRMQETLRERALHAARYRYTWERAAELTIEAYGEAQRWHRERASRSP